MNCALLASALSILAGGSYATTVSPSGTLTDLGSFSAGTYALVGSGLVDLCGSATFVMRPDGIPNSTVTCGNYGATFNPDGSFNADGVFGPAGTNAKIGGLIGTFDASAYMGQDPTPAQSSDWFLIGYSKTLTLATTGHIYASVNDTYYSNNGGAFQVTVSSVPEPATLALMLMGGFALAHAIKKRNCDRSLITS